MFLKKIAHTSSEYWLSLILRYKILRHPLGLAYAKTDLEKEATDIHMGVFEDEVIVACLILTPNDDVTIKLRQVAVDESQQGKGIGKLLQKFAEAWIIENGYKKIVCHARKTAVPFYEKQGFKTIGEEFEEVGIPHYYMEKELV